MFEFARDLTRDYVSQPGCEVPAHFLFPQLAAIATRYLDTKVLPVSPASDVDAFLAPWYGWLLERLVAAIRPDECRGEAVELPRTEAGRGLGSTNDVDFETTREPYPVIKTHVNAVVPDTARWEQNAAYRLDGCKLVHSFVKNAGLGFAIPYLHNGENHEYLPDFIVRLTHHDQRFLIMETKGYDPLKDVKTQAALRWVRAVNATGEFGIWSYRVVSDIGNVEAAVREAAE